MNLSAIHLYPIKSMRGLDVPEASVEARGLPVTAAGC
ncbi:MAG: MOSC N-terminal beta barrel domain-containing protein [Rhodanobacteraceae bacterium]|nr:MOSC N-terminal beta barrel domain-containing protein [Rhodanobacteraceae bacterium]